MDCLRCPGQLVHLSVVLPDLPELEQILADSEAMFSNGCGPKEDVCAPDNFSQRNFLLGIICTRI